MCKTKKEKKKANYQYNKYRRRRKGKVYIYRYNKRTSLWKKIAMKIKKNMAVLQKISSHPCLMMLISGLTAIALCATLSQAKGLTIGVSWLNLNEIVTKQQMGFYRINALVGEDRAKDYG